LHPPSCCLVLLKIAYFFAVFLAAFLAGAFLATAFLVAIVYSPFSTCVETTAFLLQLTECIELRNRGVKEKIQNLLQSFVRKIVLRKADGF